jgi:hypothetical protein
MPYSGTTTRLQVWRVYVNLVSHASDATALVWVSDATQADETGLQRRTVRNARQLLQAAGLLLPTDLRGAAGVRKWQVVVPGFVPTPPATPPDGAASRRGGRRGSRRGSFRTPAATAPQPAPGNDLPHVEKQATPRTEHVARRDSDAAPLSLERARAVRQQATADERARLAGGGK